MKNLVCGMLVVGSLAGIAAGIALVNMAEPRVGRLLMRKGKGIVRNYKRMIGN